MPPSLGSGESVLWESRAVQSFRGIVLTVLTFFIAVGLASLGPAGVVAGAFFLLLFFIFLIFTIWSILQLRGVHYYITNRRIVREQVLFAKKGGELPLEYLTTIRASQSFPNRLRGIGNVFFDSGAGKGIVFVRVRDPETVKQNALNAKAQLMSVHPTQPMMREREVIRETVLIQCRNCGHRSPQGTTRCPNCGAAL